MRAIGGALAAIYLWIIWGSPPEIDWPHARPRNVLGLYLVTPLLLLAGPVWLCGWIATVFAPRKTRREKDREADL